MAWGKKKRGGRKEPQFGLGASLEALRLSPQDRIPAAEEAKPKKAIPKPDPDDIEDDDPPPRERKPRPSPSARKRRSRSAFSVSRLMYWCLVLALWAAIGLVGAVVWAGAHLPPIQSLEIPKRPPTIEIVGVDGSMLAQRGEMAGANMSLRNCRPICRKPLSRSRTADSIRTTASIRSASFVPRLPTCCTGAYRRAARP